MTPETVRVLLLEDTESDRLVVEEALRTAPGQKFRLEHVDHVAHLIDRLRRPQQPHVVLIDLCVHDSEGIDTFRRVRAAAHDLPIIVQSGIADQDVAVTAVREGAQDYIVKGRFDADLLLRTIRHARERHRTEAALRSSEERYALAVSGANDGLWDWDLASGKIYFAPRFTDMIGMSSGSFGDSPERWFAAIHPEDVDDFASVIATHTSGAGGHFEHEHRIRHRDGSWRWALCRGTAIRDDKGCAARMAGSLSDITARKEAEARLLHDAFHDRLTGLANRALCLDRIAQAMRRTRRTKDCFAVLFIDLDRFKLVNDSLGHAAGDRLLLGIADRLRTVVRPADTVARLGGDEFCVVLESIHTPQDARLVADRTRQAFAEPFHLSGQPVFATASIGIAIHDDSHRSAEDLIRAADLAMYRAKSSGRDCHHTFDSEMQHRAVTRLGLESDLRQAIERQEFLLNYQPIMNLDNGEMHGVEALIRWQSPTRGLVSPADFIPLAEETGLIVPIGAWVVAEATRRMAHWDATSGRRPPLLDLSVNVSPRQFFATDIVRTIDDALRAAKLAPERLIVEITESVLVENHHLARRALCALKELGVRVHLDDFGTGFSSLSYLQQLPIDCIKIDRSFVSGIAAKGKDLEIVRAIVGLGHGLGKSVVAEGIETKGQLDRLKRLGCDFGQGFLFSRPVDNWAALPLCA